MWACDDSLQGVAVSGVLGIEGSGWGREFVVTCSGRFVIAWQVECVGLSKGMEAVLALHPCAASSVCFA